MSAAHATSTPECWLALAAAGGGLSALARQARICIAIAGACEKVRLQTGHVAGAPARRGARRFFTICLPSDESVSCWLQNVRSFCFKQLTHCAPVLVGAGHSLPPAVMTVATGSSGAATATGSPAAADWLTADEPATIGFATADGLGVAPIDELAGFRLA